MAGLLIKGGWSSSAKIVPKETLVHPEFNPSEFWESTGSRHQVDAGM